MVCLCYIPLSGQTNDNTEFIYNNIYLFSRRTLVWSRSSQERNWNCSSMRLELFDVSRRWLRQRTQSDDEVSFVNSGTLFTPFCSIRRPYITFKLPRGDLDTPPRLCNFFRYLAIGMCHFCYLRNGTCDCHQAAITIMQFIGHSLPVHHFFYGTVRIFTLSHIVSQAVFYICLMIYQPSWVI